MWILDPRIGSLILRYVEYRIIEELLELKDSVFHGYPPWYFDAILMHIEDAERWLLSREPRREGDAERLAPEKRSRL
jgi:hypothetical protein